MKKVVHLTSVHPFNDPRIFSRTCISLANAGYDTHLIAPEAPEDIIDGVKLHGVKRPSNSRIIRIFKTTWHIYRYGRKLNADVYHFHDPELIPAGIMLILQGKKVIYDVHEDYITSINQKEYIPLPFRYCMALLMNLIEMIARNLFIVILAEKYYVKRFPGKTLVLNYPNDICIKPRSDISHKERNALIYTGNISEMRGACIHASIVKEMQGIELYMVGHCSVKLLKEIQRSAGDGYKRIHIEGINTYIDHSTILEYYNKQKWLAGLAIFPSTPHYMEKELTKIFEYMSAGLPIICSDFRVWRDLIESTRTGIVVDPTDLSATANAIFRLQNNQSVWKEMSKNGIKAVHEKYNWCTQEKNLLSLYNSIFEKMGNVPISLYD